MKSGVVLGHLKYEVNEGVILRTAEAFGINNVFLVGGIDKSGAQGADKHLLYHRFDTYKEVCEFLVDNGFNLVVIENNDYARNVGAMKYPINPVFITGHENTGIPREFVEYAKAFVRIPQSSACYVRCLNTSVAMGIVLQDFHASLRRLC
ncbi:MAG: TrmH family RNA methyltransferase [bacterium]